VHRASTSLVLVIDERVSNDDVVPSANGKDNDFGNVLGCQRLDTAIVFCQ
jgi:hypothetical protein